MTRPLLIKTQVVVTPEIVQNRKIYPGVLMPSLLAFGIRIVPLLLLKISRFLLAAFRHSLCCYFCRHCNPSGCVSLAFDGTTEC